MSENSLEDVMIEDASQLSVMMVKDKLGQLSELLAAKITDSLEYQEFTTDESEMMMQSVSMQKAQLFLMGHQSLLNVMYVLDNSV